MLLWLCGFSFLLLGMYSSGETTLSASGLLVPDTLCDTQVVKRLYGDNFEDRVLVVTVASVVEPFLSPQHRENIPQVGAHEFTEMLFDYLGKQNFTTFFMVKVVHTRLVQFNE